MTMEVEEAEQLNDWSWNVIPKKEVTQENPGHSSTSMTKLTALKLLQECWYNGAVNREGENL